jgi:hypothetical protein
MTKRHLPLLLFLAVAGMFGWLAAFGQMSVLFAQSPKAELQSGGTPKLLPRPDFEFKGKVGKTFKDSDPPQFPQPVKAPQGAPNVVLILLDDTGFGQYSTFGGGVPSPTMDKLAAEGQKDRRLGDRAQIIEAAPPSGGRGLGWKSCGP